MGRTVVRVGGAMVSWGVYSLYLKALVGCMIAGGIYLGAKGGT